MKRFFQQLLTDLVGKPSDTADDDSQQHNLKLAASVILLETAAMDNEIADSELFEVTGILQKHFNLNESETAELLNAAEEARREAVDLYQFTQVINQHCSKDRKQQLMEFIWKVIYADGRLDKHEDYLVHKLARLLHIEHRDFIQAKLKARQKRNESVLENHSGNSPADT